MHNPSSPKKSSTAYTAEQRERMQRGLRILARMIVRAHLRREGVPGCVAANGTAIR